MRGFESRGRCPHCKNRIIMPKDSGGIFTCPVCNCQFKHNWTKWMIAMPLVFVVAIIGYYANWIITAIIGYDYDFGNMSMGGIVCFAVGIVAAFTGGFFPDYLILKKGIDVSKLPPADKIAKLMKKDSLYGIVKLVVLLLILALVMYNAIFGR